MAPGGRRSDEDGPLGEIGGGGCSNCRISDAENQQVLQMTEVTKPLRNLVSSDYRVTILDSYNLPLTRIWNVPSTYFGSRQLQ